MTPRWAEEKKPVILEQTVAAAAPCHGEAPHSPQPGPAPAPSVLFGKGSAPQSRGCRSTGQRRDPQSCSPAGSHRSLGRTSGCPSPALEEQSGETSSGAGLQPNPLGGAALSSRRSLSRRRGFHAAAVAHRRAKTWPGAGRWERSCPGGRGRQKSGQGQVPAAAALRTCPGNSLCGCRLLSTGSAVAAPPAWQLCSPKGASPPPPPPPPLAEPRSGQRGSSHPKKGGQREAAPRGGTRKLVKA